MKVPVPLLEGQTGDEIRIPRRACLLRASPDEASLQLGTPDEPRRFTMVALTGKPLAHWWFGTLGIDLQGVSMKKRMPVLKDHDTEQRLGFTTDVRLDPARGIVAEGKFLAKSPAAQAVLADHADGFPWQASTYLQAHNVERVPANEDAQLNGQTIRGPATIFRKSTLREVTFTALGVDDDTEATPLAASDSDEIVARVVLSVSSPTTSETDMNKTTEANPATVAAAATAVPAIPPPKTDEATLRTAEQIERERVSAILSNCAEQQLHLAMQLVRDGVPTETALAKLNADLRERLASTVKQPGATASLATGNTATVAANDAAQRLQAMPEGEEKWKAEFASDVALREEFLNDATLYLAFKRNEKRSRLTTRAEAQQ